MNNETSTTDTQAVESMDGVQAEGQQEGTLGGNESMNWEKEAKKFQSMYDRADADKKHLSQYKPLIDLLEQRPDLVETLRDNIVGNNGDKKQAEAQQLNEDEFNPWDAYNKPGSSSYEYRVGQEENRINSAVQNAMKGQEQRQFLNNTVNKLKNEFGMQENEVQEFMEFTSAPKDSVPLDNLVKLFKMNKGEYKEPVIQKPDTSNQARTAGVLQGGAAPTKSEQDGMWDQILNAAQTGSISKGIKRK